MRIGITGSIACGKSTIANHLRELGYTVVDADAISRSLTADGGAALPAVKAVFPDCFTPDGSLNRRALGALVFSNPEAKTQLEQILHPMIFDEMDRQLDAAGTDTLVFADIPLLFECGLERKFDETWAVVLDPELQVQRLMDRDKLSREAAEARIASQMPQAEKAARATRCISTSCPLKDTIAEVDAILAELLGKNSPVQDGTSSLPQVDRNAAPVPDEAIRIIMPPAEDSSPVQDRTPPSSIPVSESSAPVPDGTIPVIKPEPSAPVQDETNIGNLPSAGPSAPVPDGTIQDTMPPAGHSAPVPDETILGSMPPAGPSTPVPDGTIHSPIPPVKPSTPASDGTIQDTVPPAGYSASRPEEPSPAMDPVRRRRVRTIPIETVDTAEEAKPAPTPKPVRAGKPSGKRKARRKRRGRRLPGGLPPGIWWLLIAALVLCVTIGTVFAVRNHNRRVAEQKRIAAEEAERARHPLYYGNLIMGYASRQNLDPALVAAVILCESSFDPRAESRLGARGLMQLMQDTAAWIAHKLGEDNSSYSFDLLYDPETNIRFGTWYLGFLSRRYNGDPTKMICAYHAGQGNVDAWLKNPEYSPDGVTLAKIPTQDTMTYANRVLRARDVYEKYYFPKPVEQVLAPGTAV